MITSIIAALLTSKLAQMIGAAVALLLAWLANGALQRRKGRVAERKQAAARDAKAAIETTERMQNADADISHDPGALRDFLRARDPGTK